VPGGLDVDSTGGGVSNWFNLGDADRDFRLKINYQVSGCKKVIVDQIHAWYNYTDNSCFGYTYSTWSSCVGGTKTRTETKTLSSCPTSGKQTPATSTSCSETVLPNCPYDKPYEVISTIIGGGSFSGCCSLPTKCIDNFDSCFADNSLKDSMWACYDQKWSACIPDNLNTVSGKFTCKSSGWEETSTLTSSPSTGCSATNPVRVTTKIWGNVNLNGCCPSSTYCIDDVNVCFSDDSKKNSEWACYNHEWSQCNSTFAGAVAGKYSCTSSGWVETSTISVSSCNFVYSAWSACNSSGMQTRTETSRTPAGCTGNSILVQNCSCETSPSEDSHQFYVRANVSGFNRSGIWTVMQDSCANSTSLLEYSCSGRDIGTEMVSCSHGCLDGTCLSLCGDDVCDGNETCRNCQTDCGACGSGSGSSCTSFVYNAWTPNVCPENGVQTRTVYSSSPSNCVGGNPVLAQNCVFESENSLEEQQQQEESSIPKESLWQEMSLAKKIILFSIVGIFLVVLIILFVIYFRIKRQREARQI